MPKDQQINAVQIGRDESGEEKALDGAVEGDHGDVEKGTRGTLT